MSEFSKNMLKAGYLNGKGKAKKAELSEKDWKRWIDKIPDSKAGDYTDEEWAEQGRLEPRLVGEFATYYQTGFPPPRKRFKLLLETADYGIEQAYFWILSQLREDHGFYKFEKIIDTFSAAEQSAFWGAAQTRMKIQQDNVSQYLATIGKMVKELFQLVRELRIIDERLDIYTRVGELKSADVTLKGLYIDLVEGASKNPSSVYGLAQQVGFTILPDLFFNTHVYKSSQVDEVVEGMSYNKAIKNVLKRKLMSYLVWKEKTYKELKDRRKFQLKYLRQHWVIIKMYMDWIKPYLRNIRRMQMNEKMINSVDIVSAFETSITEIEFLAIKPGKNNMNSVVMGTFHYRTRPDMTFQQDNYAHSGPIHVGTMMMELRAYGWSDKEIQKYKKYREIEGMELYSVIDGSVKAAMEALGDDIEKYLKESGEEVVAKDTDEPKKKKKPMSWGMIDPFISVFKGVFELLGALLPTPAFGGGGKKEKKAKPGNKKGAEGAANAAAWITYKNYKKSRRMITW